MRKELLVMNIYRLPEKRGCLMMVVKGKPLKILNITDPLRFVGWIKQLSKAIDTGAKQNCSYDFVCLDGNQRKLKCRHLNDSVRLELYSKNQLRMKWQGNAYDFADAVDRMIAQLPRFF